MSTTWPSGGVVTQQSAKLRTSVQFRSRPPGHYEYI